MFPTDTLNSPDIILIVLTLINYSVVYVINAHSKECGITVSHSMVFMESLWSS